MLAMAMGEGQFSGMPAPSGRGEPIDRPRVIAPRRFDRVKGQNPLPMIGRVRRADRGRAYRRAVMALARQREADRRAALAIEVACEEADYLSLDRAMIDARIAALCETATVSETLHLRDDSGKVRATATIEAPGAMVALEVVHRERVKRLASIESLMHAAPHNSGRAALAERAPNSVNGTEVRGADRWQGSRRDSIMVARLDSEGQRYLVAPDWQCYRVRPDGARVPLVSSAVATARKVASRGTIGQASSLARVEAD